jgi:YVTN family beta-propeller protein
MRFCVLAILATTCFLSAAKSIAADGPALKPIAVIPLDGVQGRIDHMAVDEKAGRLYVAALGNDTVEVIDLASGKRVDTIKGVQEPQGIAVVPETQHILVASGADDKCRIFDSSLKLLWQIDSLSDADNVRYDAKARRAFVGYGSGALAIVDPQTGKKIGDVKLDGHPESFQLEQNGNRIFVNVPSADHVAVVDRDNRAVIAKWTPSGAKSNFPMALDEQNHRLFIGCRSPAKLLVLDTESGKTIAGIDVVGDTDDVFYDAANKQIYVSGGGGHVSVIAQKDADSYSIAGTFDTASGARTSYFVPTSSTLYVAVPRRSSQTAEIRAFKMMKVTTP